MPVQNENSDVVIINSDISPSFIPVHGLSQGNAKDNLDTILKDAKAGDIFGGDFNVNFLEPDTVQALDKLLDEKGLKIEISEGVLETLHPWFKMRSASSLYSQQLMKNGNPDIFLKDLSFKLVKKENHEASIPDALQIKLQELQAIRKKLIQEIDNLKKKNEFNAQSINELCKKLNVINFHVLDQSYGNDHPSSYYYDQDSATVLYSVNSVRHTAYNFAKHFKEGEAVNLQEMTELYEKLDKRVLIETYKLLAVRDKMPLEALDNKNNEELKGMVAARIKHSTIYLPLTKEEIRAYFENILRSSELAVINDKLKTPYSLANEEFLSSQLDFLVLDKNLEEYAKSIGKLINVVYQALAPSIPKVEDQSIALNGNGFPAFVDANSQLIPIEYIEQLQIEHIKNELTVLYKQFPTAVFSIAVIEGDTQQEKCKLIEKHVKELNTQSAAAKQSISSSGLTSAHRFFKSQQLSQQQNEITTPTTSYQDLSQK